MDNDSIEREPVESIDQPAKKTAGIDLTLEEQLAAARNRANEARKNTPGPIADYMRTKKELQDNPEKEL